MKKPKPFVEDFELVKVWVVTANAIPATVFSTQGGAKSFVEKKLKEKPTGVAWAVSMFRVDLREKW